MSNLYPLFIPLAPFIAAILSVLPSCKSNNKNYKFSWWIIFAGFANSILLLLQLIQNPEPIHLVLFDLDWSILPAAELSIDRLSAVMMVVISGFGTLLYRYSTRYLQQDPGQSRFQALLALLLSSLIFMVSSADLVMLFIFWQLLSWFLCLLFHNYADLQTVRSSFRTFIVLRAGDLAFLTGIVFAYHLYGTIQLTELFEKAALDPGSFSLFGTGIEMSGTTLVTLLIFIGVISKSAQFPLQMWLLDSLYAPTTVSAILHAGVINAGGFLLTRLAPLYMLSPTTLHFILVVGLFTMILGKSMMLVQNDIKKTLVCSTIGQMGYMIMECGIGAFSLATFHLVAHGLFKAYLFLNAGNTISEARLNPARLEQPSSQSSLKTTGWITAFLLSFLIPLGIMLWVHEALGILFLDFHGLFILFLFSWVTSSQAMLTLFRIKTNLIMKSSMLIVLGLVATAYFFAVEHFTHFLIPDHNVVAAYLEAAELPNALFLVLASLLILSISMSWYFSLHVQRDEKRQSWSRILQTQLYLFLINRLYAYGFATRLTMTLERIGRREVRVARILFYVALVQCSILLWYFAQTGHITPEATSYVSAITLTWGGLFFAWHRITKRYGNLDLNHIGGLFQRMPRFSLCFGLLIMAAIGLPPFGLFFAYLGILFDASVGISYDVILIILTWFIASLYLFKLMQKLLFGTPRTDLYYEDLNYMELIVFVALIVLLLIPSNLSQKYLMEVTQWVR